MILLCNVSNVAWELWKITYSCYTYSLRIITYRLAIGWIFFLEYFQTYNKKSVFVLNPMKLRLSYMLRFDSQCRRLWVCIERWCSAFLMMHQVKAYTRKLVVIPPFCAWINLWMSTPSINFNQLIHNIYFNSIFY